MTAAPGSRTDLKRACLTLLDEVAVEPPAGHQGIYAARYILLTDLGQPIALMFEKGERTPAHLWVAKRHLSFPAARWRNSSGVSCRCALSTRRRRGENLRSSCSAEADAGTRERRSCPCDGGFGQAIARRPQRSPRKLKRAQANQTFSRSMMVFL